MRSLPAAAWAFAVGIGWTAWFLLSTAAAQAGPGGAERGRLRLVVRGNERTRPATVSSLLPREPPARYTADELIEFERRLNNLEIFDGVLVQLVGDELRVTVREKWTLIPSVDFATGKTLRDTYVALGIDEYNLLGRAINLGASFSWEQRGPNGSVWWWEHAYNPRRGGLLAWAEYTSASFRFPEDLGWYRDRMGGGVGWNLPYSYGSPLRYEISAFAYSERLSEVEGNPTAASGTAFGTTLVATWDRYQWHDLVPSGYVVSGYLTTAAFVPSAEPRHEVGGNLRVAWSPTATTALVSRVALDTVTPGNVNHSVLLGSFYGVRGLDDAFFRNEVQSLGTVELRQSWRFAPRWALQGVLFADGARFSSMTPAGQGGQAWQSAFGAGFGARLVPTWLSGVLLRADLARLLVPEERWFLQVGFSQYF